MDDILDTSPDTSLREIKSYLTNTQYPEDLNDIVKNAYRSKAPQRIIDILSNLQPGVYHTEEELDFYLQKALR